MVLGKIISSEGYTFGQKWIISMIFRSFFITCIHKYGPNSPCASKMISIFMIFYYLYGIFWYCEVRSVGSLTLIKSRFGRGVIYTYIRYISTWSLPTHRSFPSLITSSIIRDRITFKSCVTISDGKKTKIQHHMEL